MINVGTYVSLIGELTIVCRNEKIIGLYIEDQKHYMSCTLNQQLEYKDTEMILRVKEWLDKYFCGENVGLEGLEIEFIGSDFSKLVWNELLNIPYGQVVTYKDIAKRVAKAMDRENMSNRAVGNAIGRNPISIIVPCHRVVGSDGSLTGYASGCDKKAFLLKLEKVEIFRGRIKF